MLTLSCGAGRRLEHSRRRIIIIVRRGPLLRTEQRTRQVVLSTSHVELSLANEEERVLSLLKPYELGDLLAAISSAVA